MRVIRKTRKTERRMFMKRRMLRMKRLRERPGGADRARGLL